MRSVKDWFVGRGIPWSAAVESKLAELGVECEEHIKEIGDDELRGLFEDLRPVPRRAAMREVEKLRREGEYDGRRAYAQLGRGLPRTAKVLFFLLVVVISVVLLSFRVEEEVAVGVLGQLLDVVSKDNRTTSARAAVSNEQIGAEAPVGATDIVAARDVARIVTYGPLRTATTLQFDFVCVCLFVRMIEYYPSLANETSCYYDGAGGGRLLETDRPQVMKTHQLKMKYAEKSVIFGTARNKAQGEKAAAKWERHNSTVGLIQDLETLSEIGVGGYLDLYADYFGLPPRYLPMLNEYFALWDELRVCCGVQMSKHWRHELNPGANPRVQEPHPFCGSLDIDEVERGFMNTSMFRLIDAYNLGQSINRPALVDGELDGTYCSRYNDAVRTKGLAFNQPIGFVKG